MKSMDYRRDVVTYAFAYIPGSADLCDRHADMPVSPVEAPLGQVLRGRHRGLCEVCDADLVKVEAEA